MKYEQTFEVTKTETTKPLMGLSSFGKAQYTHFEVIDKHNGILKGQDTIPLPYYNGFMVIVPAGDIKVGDKYKMILEKIEE